MSPDRNLTGCQVFRAEELPSRWDCAPLRSRIELAYGVGLPEADRKQGDVDVYGSNGLVGSHDLALVSGPGILVGRKGTIGAVHYAPYPFWPIDTVYYVVPRAGDDLRFLYYLLDYLPLDVLNAATGVPGLSRRDAYALRGAFPPPDEQAAIARILDAVDTALERTRAAVERTRELRRGLLQQAFEFVGSSEPMKDTDAGRIPKSWDAIKGREAFLVLTGGCSSVDALTRPRPGTAPDAWFMKVDDFNDPANSRTIVRTKIGFLVSENRLFKVLPLRTVVIAKRGAAIMKNRVRTTSVPISLDPNLMALQALRSMRPEFLRLQLEWRNLARYVESSGVPQLNNKDLYPRYFLRAPCDRQVEIISMAAAAEDFEDALLRTVDVLSQLKKGLMHDLLTGRIRVGNSSAVAVS
ncbi:MAG TPA: restriction endonuclease subunit S [Thermoanaerobaculia bacterium]|nr:restriction endonuclease subunit S [Thermoanaerobaculia bacterium]